MTAKYYFDKKGGRYNETCPLNFKYQGGKVRVGGPYCRRCQFNMGHDREEKWIKCVVIEKRNKL
ncbi:MAG: hypothetical protein HQK96_03790 [Nitrospirae bacterium]|nr:hypothetical protein [Nitrospirota bacterium]